ncbi:alpha/beta fold hydrolase [Bythopirellula polymerisocia]|uniref:Alpha/beta hydrolase family protein n=1 Tax=Bythopirellula polymerisocia TaxID=2528003 RepID=A0A5C6CAG5_9BACT|nr:alpha/beta fold hydrolase [Bythopirellula polymerisocia]TWU20376.1 Alpha/beta hydrolase family protein [Bythopirellula polymerisocia]
MKKPRNQHFAALVIESLFFLTLLAAYANAEPALFGIGSKTLGGRFVWSDEVIYDDWRIQRHSTFGHYRLIDPNDRRHTFGTFENCLAELERAKQVEKLPPLPKEVVVMVHGLGASRQMMNGLADYLEEEGNYYVINFGYPSTVGDISEHAKSLTNVLRHLDGVEKIDFVAHSMGNIVIRMALADLASLPPSEQPEFTYNRFVMIAPPNHGASMADNFAESKIAQAFAGEPLQQLAPGKGWQSLEQRLATPSFEFGIIAGGHGDGEGYLAAIPGDDDGLLSVDTTQLAGASDFVLAKGIHQLLPQNDQVREYTVRFLQQGHFLPSGTKHPIAAVAGAAP